MAARDPRFTTFQSRSNFVKSGSDWQRADISSAAWARLLAGASLATLFGGALTPRVVRATSDSQPISTSHYVPDFAPKAKRAIYLFYVRRATADGFGGDYKPGLASLYDQDLAGLRARHPGAHRHDLWPGALFRFAPSHWGFTSPGQIRGAGSATCFRGRDGWWTKWRFVHSLQTDAINHEPAILLMNTGNMVPGKPSMGAWLSYGLGSMNENLPTFVVLNSLTLPRHRLTADFAEIMEQRISVERICGGPISVLKGEPVLYLGDPQGLSRETRRTLIDTVNAINQMTFEEFGDPGNSRAAIHQYEMAFPHANFAAGNSRIWVTSRTALGRCMGDDAKTSRARLPTTGLLARAHGRARCPLFPRSISADGMCTRIAVGNLPKLCAADGSRFPTRWSRICGRRGTSG